MRNRNKRIMIGAASLMKEKKTAILKASCTCSLENIEHPPGYDNVNNSNLKVFMVRYSSLQYVASFIV